MHGREVGRHRLGGRWAFHRSQRPLKGQHRQHAQGGVGDGAGHHLGDNRVGQVWRVAPEGLVGGLQYHVCDYAEEPAALAVEHNVPAPGPCPPPGSEDPGARQRPRLREPPTRTPRYLPCRESVTVRPSVEWPPPRRKLAGEETHQLLAGLYQEAVGVRLGRRCQAQARRRHLLQRRYARRSQGDAGRRGSR